MVSERPAHEPCARRSFTAGADIWLPSSRLRWQALMLARARCSSASCSRSRSRSTSRGPSSSSWRRTPRRAAGLAAGRASAQRVVPLIYRHPDVIEVQDLPMISAASSGRESRLLVRQHHDHRHVAQWRDAARGFHRRHAARHRGRLRSASTFRRNASFGVKLGGPGGAERQDCSRRPDHGRLRQQPDAKRGDVAPDTAPDGPRHDEQLGPADGAHQES